MSTATQTPTFDYRVFDPETRADLIARRDEIRRLVERLHESTIETGRCLAEIKGALPPEQFMLWLQDDDTGGAA